MKKPSTKPKNEPTATKSNVVLRITAWAISGYGVIVFLLNMRSNAAALQGRPGNEAYIILESMLPALPAVIIGSALLLISGHKNSHTAAKLFTYVVGAILMLVSLYFLYWVFALHFLYQF
jgi:hypothetical protein